MTEITQEEQGYKAFVGNLAYSINSESLKDYFSPAGQVLFAKVITRFGRSQGFGFVTFETEEQVDQAVALFHAKELGGRCLNVEKAQPQKPRDPSDQTPRRKSGKYRQPRREPVDITQGVEELSLEQVAITAQGEEPIKMEKKRRPRPKKPNPSTQVKSDESKPVKSRYLQAAEKGELSRTIIFVGNLPFQVGDEDLATIFQDYNVKKATVAVGREDRKKGFGYVEFETEAEQAKVLNEVKGAICDGRTLIVRAAIPDKAASVNQPGKPKRPRRKKPKAVKVDSDAAQNISTQNEQESNAMPPNDNIMKEDDNFS